jgi:hypothetical protein
VTWRIFHPFDGYDLPDHSDGMPPWSKEELHGATFIADVGEDDNQFIAFLLRDGRTARLLSFDLCQDSNPDNTLLLWEGAEVTQ